MKLRWIIVPVLILIAIFAGYKLARKNNDIGEVVRGDIIRDVVYKKASDEELRLDIYRAENYLDKKSPVVVYVHGGYWNAGDKSQDIMLFMQGIEKLRKNGHTVISIDYRLTSASVKFPAHVEDVKDSIRWIRKNSNKYNFDGNNIGIMGASAGGNLALLSGLSGDREFLGDETLKNYSSKVNYIISWFGPTDFRNGEDKMVSDFLGVSRKANPEIYKKASPINYINRDTPPVLLIHGDRDEVVPYSQSKIFYEEGKKAGADVRLVPVKNGRHGFIPVEGKNLTPDINDIIKRTYDFIIENSEQVK